VRHVDHTTKSIGFYTDVKLRIVVRAASMRKTRHVYRIFMEKHLESGRLEDSEVDGEDNIEIVLRDTGCENGNGGG
jgi:hypothetical protein